MCMNKLCKCVVYGYAQIQYGIYVWMYYLNALCEYILMLGFIAINMITAKMMELPINSWVLRSFQAMLRCFNDNVTTNES